MSARIASYKMNPAEDVVLYGDEITEGMLVLPEDSILRNGSCYDEDEQLRRERFRKVTKLRRVPRYGYDDLIVFIGEWVDGYQAKHAYATSHAWIVKRAIVQEAEVAL